ncbi:hypothetical protein RvY_11544 [Ramazzottius varieornatus]|uniref:Major facilitator superfamily (MFS) profile domain-containing protein n=1 Tax=Ramazzottius varieornatus TaxID=947166 RepID=A0A1D1VGI8_RAMVA|nr:hypothetical protein RvY_11544 [Ramazzottius varieornatus]
MSSKHHCIRKSEILPLTDGFGMRMTTSQKPADKLTFSLLSVAFIVSFGTWFVMGYLLVALNGLQSIIVNWIRSVKCERLGGSTGISYNDSESTDLWCRHYLPQDEANILRENAELNTIWAIASSVITVGGLVATFGCTLVINKLGTKGSLLFTNVVFTAGTVMFATSKWASSFELLIAGRLIAGASMGFICVVAPLYISLLTPPTLRGTVGSIPMIMYVAGMIFGTTFSLPMILGSQDSWPILIVIPLVPVLIFSVALPFCPASPRLLLKDSKDPEGARRALIWLRGTEDVEKELASIQYDLDHAVQNQVSLLGFWKSSFRRSTFILCAVAMISQQFSGYLSIAFYSTSIFNRVGLTQLDAVYATIGLFAVLLVFSLLGSVLMEKAGRKTLLLGANAVETLALTLLVMCMALTKQGHVWTQYASVACVFLFMACYGIGPFSVPWNLPTELFGPEASASAMTWTGVSAWTGSLVTTFAFPVVVAVAEEYIFLIFIGFLVVSSTFLYFRLPETKGRSVQEVQTILQRRKG